MVDPVRLLIVDDDPFVRSGLRFLLESADDITVVGEATDGDQVVGAVRRLRPTLVLMDLRMARVDGVEATALVRALPSPPDVIVLTTWDVDQAVLRSLEAGASGFLLKSAAPAEILGAVRAVAAGDAVLSPRSTRQLLTHLADDDRPGRREAARQRLERLSEREREVAVRVARGSSNAEIARELYLSEGTVKSHLASMLTKLPAPNRVAVAVLVERAGFSPEGG